MTVDASVAETFRVFTEQFGSWWPVETHSMAADREDGSVVAQLVFEGREGGRIYEVDEDGTEGTWAHVLAWDPPHGFILAWKPNLRDEPPTEVEVTFTEVDGRTRVDLGHRGWERLGERARQAREGYETGWAMILEERFAPAVDAAFTS